MRRCFARRVFAVFFFYRPTRDRGALDCRWNAIATQSIGLVPFQARGILPVAEEQSRTRSHQSGGVEDQPQPAHRGSDPNHQGIGRRACSPPRAGLQHLQQQQQQGRRPAPLENALRLVIQLPPATGGCLRRLRRMWTTMACWCPSSTSSTTTISAATLTSYAKAAMRPPAFPPLSALDLLWSEEKRFFSHTALSPILPSCSRTGLYSSTTFMTYATSISLPSSAFRMSPRGAARGQ